MLYFTGEVFLYLANQNRGHICVMSESKFYNAEKAVLCTVSNNNT